MQASPQLRKQPDEAAFLSLSINGECGMAHRPFLRRHLKRAHALLGSRLTELSVGMVGDDRMSVLHEQFLSITGPTDVLTFPLEFDATGACASGEIVICVTEARRRARERKTPLEHELLLYAIHGMLHLSGYDDVTARQFKIMHGKEDELLIKLGIGAVFGPQKRQ